jgi:uncharacterized protein YndB with AHSA1/START domain
MNLSQAQPSADNEILITRLVNAPCDLVWRAFTEQRHMTHWWGPNGFRTTTFDMDVRVGGWWRFVMRGPDGTDYPNWIHYTQVQAPELLAYDHGSTDESQPEFQGRITLEAQGDKTLVNLRLICKTKAQRDEKAKYAIEGGQQTLGRLDAYAGTTPADKEFVISRTLHAPRALVWKAWSEAEHLGQWWGPKECSIRVADLEFAPGGSFHYAMQWPGGQDMWGRFRYRHIVPQERIEFINSFSDAQGNITRAPFFDDWPLEVFNTVVFAEQGDQTVMTLRSGPINATAAERERFASIFESMQQGFDGTFDKLAEHLATA